MLNLTAQPACWGFLGAVIYAGPKLTTCIYSTEGRPHVLKCAIEAITALVIGTVAAASFEPFLASYIHAMSEQDMKAISATIGMLANSTAPGIIKFMGDNVLNRIRGGH